MASQATVSGWRRAIAWFIAGAALSPIFIRIPDLEILVLQIFAAEIPGDSQSNAVSLLALFIAALGVPLIPDFLRALARRQPLAWAALALAVYFGTLGLVTAVRTADLFPILAAVQYAFPIAALLIGYLFRRRRTVDWQPILMLFVVSSLLLPALVFVHIYFSDDGRYVYRTLVLTNRYFYAIFSHLPTSVLAAAILLLGWARPSSRLRVASFAVAGAACVLYTTWSVATLSFALTALLVSSALLFRPALATRGLRRNPLFAACITILVLGLILPPLGMLGHRNTIRVPRGVDAARLYSAGRPDAIDLERIGGEGTINLLQKSGSARAFYMREGLRRWAQRPVLGLGFEPDEFALIRGSIVEKKQFFQSHNQYIDALLKSGIVGLVLLAAFYLWFVARPLLSTAFSPLPPDLRIRYCVAVGVLAGIAVAANLQLYVTVWTTGVPLGFYMGYLVAESELPAASSTG